MANRELREKGVTVPECHGHVAGVELGEKFNGKGALSILGLHSSISAGIHFRYVRLLSTIADIHRSPCLLYIASLSTVGRPLLVALGWLWCRGSIVNTHILRACSFVAMQAA